MAMPMPPSTPAPSERFAGILRSLILAVAAMSGGDRLTHVVIALIGARINGIRRRFAWLAARIAAGSYAPRRPSATPRRNPAERAPRKPNALPAKFGWLLPMLPDAVGYRSQLEYLLRDPEMVALLAAAPASMA